MIYYFGTSLQMLSKIIGFLIKPLNNILYDKFYTSWPRNKINIIPDYTLKKFTLYQTGHPCPSCVLFYIPAESKGHRATSSSRSSSTAPSSVSPCSRRNSSSRRRSSSPRSSLRRRRRCRRRCPRAGSARRCCARRAPRRASSTSSTTRMRRPRASSARSSSCRDTWARSTT